MHWLEHVVRRAVAGGIVVLALAVLPARLAAQTDVIRGKVTNSEGLPLPGVRVTATSIPGNVTREARTNNTGSFQIAFPGGTGDYFMGYALIGYNYRQFEVKRVADEEVLIADARLSVVQLDTMSVVASSAQRISRGQRTPDVSGTDRPIAGSDVSLDLQGDIAAMAASLPGVLLLPGLDGAADGFSVLGLGADQNNVTLNGMQVGANGLPRDASISTSLTTSSFDPSRGGFSGANFNIRSSSGSNYRTRGSSLVLNTPQLMWTDRAGRSLGAEYTNVSLGGVVSGPISLDKAFYNISYQLGRQSRNNQTLLNMDALGLQTVGVAMDSVVRFIDILKRRGIPVVAGPSRPSRISDNGSVFGSFDFSSPSSASGNSYNITFNGNWGRQSSIGGGATQLSSASGDRTNWSGGIQAGHSGYVGRFLSETRAGLNLSRDYGSPYLLLPAGRVRVNSDFAGGANGVQSLAFGGNQGLSSSSQSTGATLQNTLSWFDDANKHRLKFSTELGFSGNSQDMSSNLLGTFTFNSLADLETGLPASYSRTLSARRRSTGQVTAAFSLGDTYRRNPDLQWQYGLRLEGVRYTATPTFNPVVESVFGHRNDRVPMPVSLSPRLGFAWTLGNAQEVSAFAGAARAPRAVVRGGIGVFTNGAGSGSIGTALDNTGLPSGAQQIVCVGPAAPTPAWASYPAAVPDHCGDGTAGTVFSNSAPNVTFFARDFRPQRTVRSNLSWNGAILDARFTANVEGTYSLNLNQQRSLDVNFAPNVRFTLADDGRPVYVQTASIVPTTGTIASRDARVSQDFARVTELRSDMQSRTGQLSIRLSPIVRTPSAFGWNAAYTYTHIREQVSGFSSTSGNPLTMEWAASGQGPHQISYSLRYLLLNAVMVSWNGSFRSGSAFTPTIAGDVNGDGYSNDRAFIYPTNAADTALANGMNRLLSSSTSGTRSCLERQIGRIAERNSCRAPWSSSASLNISLDRAKLRMPQRMNVSFSLSNPLGAADLLVNGSNHLRGWGQNPFPDQSLLYVRGFDAQTKRYKYEVNQRFGATQPQFMTLRSPVTLTASLRFDLGAVRERQTLGIQLSSGRTEPGERYPESYLRMIGTGSTSSPMGTILRQQDSLQLTVMQADSIASMNRRFAYRIDSLWTPIARQLAKLPTKYDEGEAWTMFLNARRAQVDMLISLAPAIRELLTDEQRRKLPAFVTNLLDPRYLISIRNGSGLYVGGSGLSMGGSPMAMAAGAMITEFSILR